MKRFLIVNADDFGLSAGVNRGIIEAHEHGIVTSASLMVRQRAVAAAAAYAKQRPRLSVGLHLDLGEWIFQNGEWVKLYEMVNAEDATAVATEVAAQLGEFRRLVGRDPTHLDSHQHVHRKEPARSIMLRIARELDVPLREFCSHVCYCGDFYGQTGEGEPLSGAITVENFCAILASLPEGTTELGCHAGYDDGLQTMYRCERAEEVKVLCDREVTAALSRFDMELTSFKGISSSRQPG